MKIQASWYNDYKFFKECASSVGKDGIIQFGIYVDMTLGDCIWQIRKDDYVVDESYDHSKVVGLFNELVK